jgi:cytidine deaminase
VNYKNKNMAIVHQGSFSFSEIHTWLLELRQHAYCPLSNYAVAAVGRAQIAGGAEFYFGGVNVENADHRLSTHAEEGVLAAMVTALGPAAQLHELWTIAGPRALDEKSDHPLAKNYPSCCGKCRQQIAGFAAMPDMPVHPFSLRGDYKTITVAEFLPHSFTFKDVYADFTRPAAIPAEQALTLPQVKQKLFRTVPQNDSQALQWLANLRGFNPVTQQSRPLLLSFTNGQAAAGVMIEDAAFISISSAQAALAIAYAAGIVAPLKAVIQRRQDADDALQHAQRQVLQTVWTPLSTVSFL